MFFDIEMPEIDGVSATKKIREIDDKVMIIFVTAMGQLAAEGYSVEAFDFLVKPVPVSMLETTIDRALKRLARNAKTTIKISFKTGVRVCDVEDLAYIEVLHHRLLYHFKDGESVEAWVVGI